MNKPFKFTIVCDKTGREYQTNREPNLHELQTYEPTGETGVSELRQTKTVWVDTRYEARIRLYNYLTFIKKGLPIPRYQPYKNTDIGKSIPILQ